MEVIVESQIMLEYENQHYAYIKYYLNFKHESLLQDARLNNFPAVKIAVKKKDKWMLTKTSPLGGKFKFAYYNCSVNRALGLFKGSILVNNQNIISNKNIIDIDKLAIGMDSEAISDAAIEMGSERIKLFYSGEREIKQSGKYWIKKLGSHPVDPEKPIGAYKPDQIKLFLAVHQAIIEHTTVSKNSSISIAHSDLQLGDDKICKTHIIKYGYWDENNNCYIFRIERNGPYDIKAFSVYVTISENEFILDFKSSQDHFEYVDYISERLHARLFSYRFNKVEKYEILEELKASCMSRVSNNTVIDFDCFSSFINQLSKEEGAVLKNIYK